MWLVLGLRQAEPVWLVERELLVKRRVKPVWLVEPVRLILRRGKPVWLFQRLVKPVWLVSLVRPMWLVGHGCLLQAGSAMFKNWHNSDAVPSLCLGSSIVANHRSNALAQRVMRHEFRSQNVRSRSMS